MRPGTDPPYAPGAESVLPTEPVLKPCTCEIEVKSTTWHLVDCSVDCNRNCWCQAFHAALHLLSACRGCQNKSITVWEPVWHEASTLRPHLHDPGIGQPHTDGLHSKACTCAAHQHPAVCQSEAP